MGRTSAVGCRGQCGQAFILCREQGWPQMSGVQRPLLAPRPTVSSPSPTPQCCRLAEAGPFAKAQPAGPRGARCGVPRLAAATLTQVLSGLPGRSHHPGLSRRLPGPPRRLPGRLFINCADRWGQRTPAQLSPGIVYQAATHLKGLISQALNCSLICKLIQPHNWLSAQITEAKDLSS